MISFFLLHYYAHLIFFFCAPIIGIIFWKKQKNKRKLDIYLRNIAHSGLDINYDLVNLRETFMHDIKENT